MRMAKVTPVTVVFRIILLIAVSVLSLPAVGYYTNPTIANTLNGTFSSVSSSFQSTIYNPTYNATFNSSGGLKASENLQSFSGLAFMFGNLYYVASYAWQGLPMIQQLLGTTSQYSILPGVNIYGLIMLFIMG